MSQPREDVLIQLAERVGLAPSYRDVWDNEQRVAPETLQALLAAMGFPAHTDDELAASTRALDAAEWDCLLPAVEVVTHGRPETVPITLRHGSTGELAWRVELENGVSLEGSAQIEGLARGGEHGDTERRRLELPASLPMGYHRLHVTAGGDEASMRLIVAPERCFLPEDFAGDDFGINPRGEGRVWGLAAQLYSLRSSRNWGIGDFTDLKDLAVGSAPRGARAIGLNPLHALFPDEPRHISPYSPSSRCFLNPLYLDVEAVPDFQESIAAQDLVRSRAFQEQLAQARAAELVDHVAVSKAKTAVLELLWRSFRDKHLGLLPGTAPSARGESLLKFRREGGPPLERFAIFQALHERFYGQIFAWSEWPERYHDPKSEAVEAFARDHAERVDYFIYLQWETDRQLGDVDYVAEAAGLSIGLYRDVAVGVDPNGADGWTDQSLLVTGSSVGAPPDLLNRRGQNWGLPAFDPVALRRSGYEPFIRAISANMRHAGAIRIDHAMSLKQLYVIPQGMGADRGAYIRYPFRDLLRIVALESQRSRCAVVGEDLGTVPEGFREALADAGILSYRLLVFERRADGSFLPPSAYPPLATAAFSTHDLATLKGFWLGRDLDWREKLSLYPDDKMVLVERDRRVRERRLLLDALIGEGVLPGELADTLLPENDAPVFRYELVEAVHRYLGHSPARLLLIQMEDAVGSEEMINLPGTVDQHPNWRRKLSLSVSDILDDKLFQRLTEAVNEARQPVEAPGD